MIYHKMILRVEKCGVIVNILVILQNKIKMIKDMNKKICWTIVIVVLSVLVSCGKRETLDPQKDYILMRAMESSRNQSDDGIDVEALENCALVYEKNREWGKLCWCDALIGYKLFFEGNYDKSLVYLKKAEANLQYCDSMSSFVYAYIVKNTMTTDTILARHYAQKALEKNLEYRNLRRLPYSYMDMSLLTKGDSARYYLEKSLECFDDWGDKIAKCKYALWHKDELESDTIIAYAKPCYDSIYYAGDARILVDAYLRKGEVDSAEIYIEALGRHKFFKTEYSFYNSRRLLQLGMYEEAARSWEETYYRQREDYLFMLSQRLGAINAEYDLLNVELQRKKEKLRLMGIYNSALMVVMAVMVVAFVVISRYRKNIDGLEKEILQRKERFSTLFEEYRKGYELNRETIFADANMNLEALHVACPTLTKTDMAIIWLMFMNCDKETICSMMNISSRYYYNRKSIIQRTLKIDAKEARAVNKEIVKIVRKYICKSMKR